MARATGFGPKSNLACRHMETCRVTWTSHCRTHTHVVNRSRAHMHARKTPTQTNTHTHTRTHTRFACPHACAHALARVRDPRACVSCVCSHAHSNSMRDHARAANETRSKVHAGTGILARMPPCTLTHMCICARAHWHVEVFCWCTLV